MPTGIYERTKKHNKAISKALKGHSTSKETKRKIGLANRGIWVKFNCDYCGEENEEKQSHYRKSKRHFCNMSCYKAFVRELPFYEQNAYRGVRKRGEPAWVYSAGYRKSHKERISHLKAKRYAREKGAKGSHTLEEWEELKRKYGYKCAVCGERKELTKDHKVPLSEGGTDLIKNIQPLCRSCNSRKWKKLT